MKKLFFVMVAVIGFGISANAQDVIITADGKKINSRVTEISENYIRYKLFENLLGPTYVIKKTEIATILYENGYIEIFKMSITTPLPQTGYYQRQYTQVDLKSAKNLRNAGITLFSTGMVFTFPIALSLAFTNYGYYDPYYGYYYRNYAQSDAGLAFIIMGPPITVSGIIMWAVGQTRMNRINPDGFSLLENKKVQLNLAVGGNSMGLKLNF